MQKYSCPQDASWRRRGAKTYKHKRNFKWWTPERKVKVFYKNDERGFVETWAWKNNSGKWSVIESGAFCGF